MVNSYFCSYGVGGLQVDKLGGVRELRKAPLDWKAGLLAKHLKSEDYRRN
jgi:hypothetical protein